jgi:predicted XRE-type DNA-binding protein
MTTKAKSPPVLSVAQGMESMEPVEMGSGNVFVDLGLPDPDERKLRVQLAIRLNDLLQAEGLTQAAAAKRLGLAQPHVSELKNYKLGRFSSERLLHCITLLNRDVEIFIRPRAAGADKAGAGAVMVWAAA